MARHAVVKPVKSKRIKPHSLFIHRECVWFPSLNYTPGCGWERGWACQRPGCPERAAGRP